MNKIIPASVRTPIGSRWRIAEGYLAGQEVMVVGYPRGGGIDARIEGAPIPRRQVIRLQRAAFIGAVRMDAR